MGQVAPFPHSLSKFQTLWMRHGTRRWCVSRTGSRPSASSVLLVSGIAILLAHPRLYWGETGAVGSPSLIDLPLPFVLDVPIRGPGPLSAFSGRMGLRVHRSGLRFDWASPPVTSARIFCRRAASSRCARSAAWLKVTCARPTAGDLDDLQRPAAAQLHGRRVRSAPLMIWTGLAMSPAVTSVLPAAGDRIRRAAERANDSLLRRLCAHALFAAARRHGLAVGLHGAHAGDDHGAQCRAQRRKRHERQCLTAEADHDRPRRRRRRGALGAHRTPCGSLRTDPGESAAASMA